MTAGDQRGQHIVDHAVLADQGLLQFSAQRLRQLAGTLALLGGVAGAAGLDLFTHSVFLKVCRWATWRLKSALLMRCFGTGLRA